MRIHLISPTHYLRDGSLHKTTRYWTSAITLPYLKALTPSPHQVDFTDELMSDLDLARVEREADVVGITAMGPQIRRAYDLADHFRARGKKVVLGGTWVSLVPDESLGHADAVVAGEAEYVWSDVLADLEAGRSRGIYRAERWHDLRGSKAVGSSGRFIPKGSPYVVFPDHTVGGRHKIGVERYDRDDSAQLPPRRAIMSGCTRPRHTGSGGRGWLWTSDRDSWLTITRGGTRVRRRRATGKEEP